MITKIITGGYTDGGYNGIVYFNDDDKHGTCFTMKN